MKERMAKSQLCFYEVIDAGFSSMPVVDKKNGRRCSVLLAIRRYHTQGYHARQWQAAILQQEWGLVEGGFGSETVQSSPLLDLTKTSSKK